jgi:hypothetical protein
MSQRAQGFEVDADAARAEAPVQPVCLEFALDMDLGVEVAEPLLEPFPLCVVVACLASPLSENGGDVRVDVRTPEHGHATPPPAAGRASGYGFRFVRQW